VFLDQEFAPIWTIRSLVIFSRTNLDIVVSFLRQWREVVLAAYDHTRHITQSSVAPTSSALGANSSGASENNDDDLPAGVPSTSATKESMYKLIVDVVFCRSLLLIALPLVDDAYDSILAVKKASVPGAASLGASLASTAAVNASSNSNNANASTSFGSAALDANAKRLEPLYNRRASAVFTHNAASLNPYAAMNPDMFKSTLATISSLRNLSTEAQANDLSVTLRLCQVRSGKHMSCQLSLFPSLCMHQSRDDCI